MFIDGNSPRVSECSQLSSFLQSVFFLSEIEYEIKRMRTIVYMNYW